ncbi:hypothetical protein EYC84_010649 [Monilinia fructicola]|uniref:Uncharacterized protein n=1 Tax=Monilinia fructicola TaxID=38448 RepID=A0A5M9JAG8_MONFR|nr:hypothetical protein EYC84_010649 [Monilinia fructicola]
MFNAGRTYRFRYDSDFPNISPPVYPGAYHAAELPLLFRTAAKYHGPTTTYEDELSEKFLDLWLGFAKNPQDGLRDAGWFPYAEGKVVSIRGADTPIQFAQFHRT